MADIIKTISVGTDFVKSNGILLEQTPDTALVFIPGIYLGAIC